ncbi:hypothetical protein K461DRAFT_103249 [Myriangium duriaei CBS 260.36]|uniref:Uncharacterized protein n=1 Tax=Myriangium duriaei CBS 260.36 TaxID=1168546 RepID=A0A9P4J4V7_9PEZI|nr:hypothetical protein K461DRAFT_103249 [Myriangium duriaei CBS 260.36]
MSVKLKSELHHGTTAPRHRTTGSGLVCHLPGQLQGNTRFPTHLHCHRGASPLKAQESGNPTISSYRDHILLLVQRTNALCLLPSHTAPAQSCSVGRGDDAGAPPGPDKAAVCGAARSDKATIPVAKQSASIPRTYFRNLVQTNYDMSEALLPTVSFEPRRRCRRTEQAAVFASTRRPCYRYPLSCAPWQSGITQPPHTRGRVHNAIVRGGARQYLSCCVGGSTSLRVRDDDTTIT